MSRSLRGLLFALAFVLVLVSAIPLSLALQLFGLPPSLAATGASGTLWQGQLHDARWGRTPLGRLSLRLSPWQLVRGQVQLQVSGPHLSAHVLRGRRSGVEHTRGTLDLAYAGLDLRLHLDDASAVFARGGCAYAGGSLVLEPRHAQAIGAALPVLRATPRCEDGQWLARFEAGPGATLRIERLELRLDANGTLATHVQLAGVAPAARVALAAQGFEASGEVMVLHTAQQLWQ